ncbi:MAG: hypothetical protein HPY44_07015 [Armatimonadetes bacterium]|nr:hypothetical protein [Armatimonadota bacterium]
MTEIGPIIGMMLLGALVGWLFGRACLRVFRLAVFLALAIIALQLIGYHAAAVHWDSLAQSAGDAAREAREHSGLAWRLAVYNLPLTIGFAAGTIKALIRPRR